MKSKIILRDSKHRAVLEHRAVIFTKTGVERLADGAPRRVAGDHPVNQRCGVFAANIVFVKRRDIDEAGAVADRVILVVVHHFVGACDKIPRPGAPVLTDTQGRGARVKRSSERHVLFGSFETSTGSVQVLYFGIDQKPLFTLTCSTKLPNM